MTQDTQRAVTLSVEEFIRQAMHRCREASFSFALWKLPNSSAIQFAASGQPVGTHDINLEDTLPGFLFAPFDPGQKKIFLPADEFFRYESGQFQVLKGNLLETIPTNLPSPTGKKIPTSYYVRTEAPGSSADETAYRNLVIQCRDLVADSDVEKIVPSRFKWVQLAKDFEITETFLALGKRYPSALVSVFSSPDTGTWMGATPEMLVKVDAQQHFHTAAVAGTQQFVAGTDIRTITWTQKEIEEQALVERYVISCFKKIRLREFEERGPKTVVAGNVVHLKTEFEVDMTATHYPQLGSVMLQLLHPTSAVCGMPLDPALAFLKKHEGYNRQFYSGYLGPVHISQESQLFVNLRCMQLFEETAMVYAGAGVLADSDPEKEWEETELKMNTLLEVIRQ